MTVSIFSHDIGRNTFEVWVTNGVLQYVINGAIQYDVTSVSDFLTEAAKTINKPNTQDASVVTRNGNVSDNALENYQNGAVTYDAR